MTGAEQRMAARTAPLRLVIFDCDGVLVDSEEPSNRLLAEEFTALGWPMTLEQATALFVGSTLPDIKRMGEAQLGRALPDDWIPTVLDRVVALMRAEARPVPGALEALRAVSELGLPWRVASNSSHDEMAAKFGRLGITALVQGRTHSHSDVGRGKPAPDLFLAAARAEGVSPPECLVIEDSVPGAVAARLAGMECLGLDRFGDGAALRAEGATPFHDMRELPALIALAARQPA
jgi:HAD superfamily hydrolase (TIGR01509 family)